MSDMIETGFSINLGEDPTKKVIGPSMEGYCTKHATYYQFDGKMDICPVCLAQNEKDRRMEEIREALEPWLKKIEQLHLLHAGVAIDIAKTYGRLEEIERMLRDL